MRSTPGQTKARTRGTRRGPGAGAPGGGARTRERRSNRGGGNAGDVGKISPRTTARGERSRRERNARSRRRRVRRRARRVVGNAPGHRVSSRGCALRGKVRRVPRLRQRLHTFIPPRGAKDGTRLPSSRQVANPGELGVQRRRCTVKIDRSLTGPSETRKHGSQTQDSPHSFFPTKRQRSARAFFEWSRLRDLFDRVSAAAPRTIPREGRDRDPGSGSELRPSLDGSHRSIGTRGSGLDPALDPRLDRGVKPSAARL